MKLEKNSPPASFRHTFLTDLYREARKIRLVQKASGHADVSTTMASTNIVNDELEDALKSFCGEKRQPVEVWERVGTITQVPAVTVWGSQNLKNHLWSAKTHGLSA